MSQFTRGFGTSEISNTTKRVDPETAKLDRALHENVLKRQAAHDAAKAKEDAKYKEEKAGTGRDLGGLLGCCELTKEKVKSILDSDRRIYYRSHDLNDKLYIHYGGYAKFQNLEGFTGLKTLYAECNAFDSVEGLEHCTSLRSLFIHENCLKSMAGMGLFKECWSLNVSSNFLERIDEVRAMPKLNTLLIAKNRIGFNGIEDLMELAGSHISCLDIQDNKIDDPEILPEVLMKMPHLSCLYLKGNPVTKKIPNYRKTVIASLRGLKYLDDRPVFVEDRRYAEAFNRGGLPEEREERKRFKAEKDEAHRRNMEAFRNMVENARKEKQERLRMREEDKYTDETDPVEDPDRRVSRMKKEWEEKNADKLKDDAKEHALKCLAAEKEKEEKARKKKKEASGEKEEEEEDDDEPPALHPTTSSAEDPEAPHAPQKKEDNRSLTYDDIWDDVPAGSSSAGAVPPPFSSVGGAPKNSADMFDQIWKHGEEELKARGGAGASEQLEELRKLKDAAKKHFSEVDGAPPGSGDPAEDLERSTRAPSQAEPEEGEKEEPGLEARPTRMRIQGDDGDDTDEEEEVAPQTVSPAAAADKPVFAPPPRRGGSAPVETAAAAAAPSKEDEDNELDEMD